MLILEINFLSQILLGDQAFTNKLKYILKLIFKLLIKYNKEKNKEKITNEIMLI